MVLDATCVTMDKQCAMGGDRTRKDTELPPQGSNKDDENEHSSKDRSKEGASKQKNTRSSSSESKLKMQQLGEYDASSNCDGSEFSSDSSSSSSSDDESESESEATSSDIQNDDSNTQLHQLQREIRARQKLMAKLLRDKEGTAYAHMIQGQEELANSKLLGKVAKQEPTIIMSLSSEAKSPLRPSAVTAPDHTSKLHDAANPFRTIRSMLLEEYNHTLPAAFSLIVHCMLYITIYTLITRCVSWSCDSIIIYFTGWDTDENWFDSSNHESVFHAIVLILSLCAARITGVMYDWNENRVFQKRITFQLRNKWLMGCWEARLMNYFHGGALHEKYDKIGNDESCKDQKGTTNRPKQKRWGKRMKYILDLFSFFICHKCVDYFFYGLVVEPMSEITQSVVDGLPSRQLQNNTSQHSNHHLGRNNGVSYPCPGVVTNVLENPYALDMLNWIATEGGESQEAMNWIMNAKKCGWSSLAEGEEENGALKGKDDDTDTGKVEDEIDDTNSIDGTDYSSFVTKRRIKSAHDDKYLQETIPREAYWELAGVGDQTPKIYDPNRQMLFLLMSTAIALGLLRAFGIPFLII